MVLTWTVQPDKYHFFTLYEMSSSLISLQIMLNKDSNKVDSNTLIIKDLVCCHFYKVNELPVDCAKVLMLERFLAYADFLVTDPRNTHLPSEELKQNINDFSETFIKYKAKAYIESNPQSVETVSIVVPDPLAPDEQVV